MLLKVNAAWYRVVMTERAVGLQERGLPVSEGIQGDFEEEAAFKLVLER